MLNCDDIILMFGTPHRALKAEKVLKEAELSVTLIPAPAGLAKGCGLAIRCTAKAHQAVLDALSAADLPPARTFCQTADGIQPL